jgi:DNA polymerase-3 subunit chi
VTEIDGHYNMPDKVGYACRLLRKAVGAQARLVVLADPETLDAIDQALWTLQPSDFIAHCRDTDEPSIVSRSPVVLADRGTPPLPDRPILLNLGPEVPAGFERFERLIDLVGSDDADRQAGRARWRHYKDRGYAIRTHPYAGSAA